MTTSNHIRILKADDVAHHAIVTLPRPTTAGHRTGPEPTPSRDDRDGELEILVEEARAQGAADAASTLEPALRQLASSLSGLSQQQVEARSAAMRSDSEAIIETALAVTHWILDRELRHADAILELAQRALAGVGDPEPTRLRVHPHLVDAVRELAPEDVVVTADADLALGEFVAETAGPDVALRYDRALHEARQVLQSEGLAS